MVKFKIHPSEATEVMEFYYKLTGEKITTIDKLEQVAKVMADYKKQIKIHV